MSASESNDSEYEMDGEPNEDIYTGNEEIQVDFEGRSPMDGDYDGIKQLLHQLFLNAKINLNQLSELIIGQNTVGSVLWQCIDDSAVPQAKVEKMDEEVEQEEEEEESDDEDDDTIFGVTSVVNLSNPQGKECTKQIQNYLIDKCSSADQKEELKKLLTDEKKPTGLILNERFINIPPQIAVPMLENLQKDLRRAVEKKLPFEFAQFVMLIKFYRSEVKARKAGSKKDEKNRNKPQVVHYSNPEEEALDDFLLSYEFSVAGDADTALTGNWLEDDKVLTPYRKVVVFEAKNLSQMIEKIKAAIA